MIDFHAHLLPGLDDGAEFMGEALAMARIAYDGVRGILLTPHHFAGRYNNNREKVLVSFAEFSRRLSIGIPGLTVSAPSAGIEEI